MNGGGRPANRGNRAQGLTLVWRLGPIIRLQQRTALTLRSTGKAASLVRNCCGADSEGPTVT